ncbi:hypothetical protein D3C87_841880 [compost metagenome]
MKIVDSFNALSRFGQVSIILSLVILTISITQPAFYIESKEDPEAWADSWLLFLFGWTFPLGGAFVPFLIWLANPIYIISIIFTLKGKKIGFYLSFLASLIAISFIKFDSIITSESGRESPIKSLELGYKLWLTSLVIMSIGTGINLYFKRRGDR